MVLPDINDAAPDNFSDNPYPDQNDPYASSSSSSSTARFDSSNMSQPIPILGPLIGYSERAVRFKVEQTLKFGESRVSRQLTQEEAQALASHIYDMEQAKSYFAASGVAAGTLQAYRTMAMNRYPFYQPKIENINPNKFSFVRGPMAPFARHAWRFTLYMIVAGNMGSIIGQLVAQPIAAMRTSEDPKLEQFGHELKAAANAERGRSASQRQEIQDQRKEFERQTRDRSGMGPSPQAKWGKQPPAQTTDDDMSPTAGNEGWGSQSSGSGPWDTYSSQTEQNMSHRSQGASSNDVQSRRSSGRAPLSSQSSFNDNGDDASPTGGFFQDEVKSNSQTQSQSRPGESRWERIRRGEAPTPGRRQVESERRETREAPASDDPFAFGDGAEDRNVARERAMQERASRLAGEGQAEDKKKW
ncbi:hypothetical protein GQ44DRAFT_371500 [Phaeosphaeriaceae sp. PMI808]|nr:hypothetical protein GQ44DRAFT_371500 [Phaeosphaeriaceae sp. PMI808]